MYSYPHKTAYRAIEKRYPWDFAFELENRSASLYMHIPFCSSKCGYCNLFSMVCNERETHNLYISAMQKQADELSSHMNIAFDSHIIGGGSPLIFQPEMIDKLFEVGKNVFNMNYNEVFSCIEASPDDVTEEKLSVISENKVNRISIGVQSFLDSELYVLGRMHSADSALDALQKIKYVGFESLNIDLIYGVPGQTNESFLFSVKKAIEFVPDEIFIYPLYIRPNKRVAGEMADRYSMYWLARKMLLENGYHQHSMRHFLKKKTSNVSCGFENTISLGVGGRSYIGRLHCCAPYSDNQTVIKRQISEYISNGDNNLIDYGFILNNSELKRRFIIKNLFVSSGMNMDDYKIMFDSELTDEFSLINEWIEKEICFEDKVNRRFFLTEKGIALSDYLGSQLISPTVTSLMDQWEDYK